MEINEYTLKNLHITTNKFKIKNDIFKLNNKSQTYSFLIKSIYLKINKHLILKRKNYDNKNENETFYFRNTNKDIIKNFNLIFKKYNFKFILINDEIYYWSENEKNKIKFTIINKHIQSDYYSKTYLLKGCEPKKLLIDTNYLSICNDVSFFIYIFLDNKEIYSNYFKINKDTNIMDLNLKLKIKAKKFKKNSENILLILVKSIDEKLNIKINKIDFFLFNKKK